MGGGDKFLAFLKNEAIPLIEKTYRTAPYRMLAGHSRGGLLVAYSLLAEPDLFHARFAHSPALWATMRSWCPSLLISSRQRRISKHFFI